MTTYRVLIVEDDAGVHGLLIDVLKSAGNFEIASAYSGTEALLRLEQSSYDLMLLDLMLPGLDGEEVLERAQKLHRGGTIVLSAKSELEDKVQLLRLGADDYLTKPFHQLELLARIESVLRRFDSAPEESEPLVTYKALTYNPETLEVAVADTVIHLTKTELELLVILLRHPRKVLSRQELYQELWGEDYIVEDNAINVHMSNLRKKIAAADPENDYIETVWGIGFKLV